jgi:hypothetical protein
MHVLEDERKRILAAVRVSRLSHGTVGRIGPERLVVRAPVVVAGEPEAGRRPEDEERRREREKPGPEGRSDRTSYGGNRRRSPESRRARGSCRAYSARPGTPPSWRTGEMRRDRGRPAGAEPTIHPASRSHQSRAAPLPSSKGCSWVVFASLRSGRSYPKPFLSRTFPRARLRL